MASHVRPRTDSGPIAHAVAIDLVDETIELSIRDGTEARFPAPSCVVGDEIVTPPFDGYSLRETCGRYRGDLVTLSGDLHRNELIHVLSHDGAPRIERVLEDADPTATSMFRVDPWIAYLSGDDLPRFEVVPQHRASDGADTIAVVDLEKAEVVWRTPPILDLGGAAVSRHDRWWVVAMYSDVLVFDNSTGGFVAAFHLPQVPYTQLHRLVRDGVLWLYDAWSREPEYAAVDLATRRLVVATPKVPFVDATAAWKARLQPN